jgi:hypothetical protein
VASAQIPNALKGEIPFAFYVGDKQMPAGTYTLTMVNPAVVVVRTLDWKDGVMVLTHPSSAQKPEEGAKLLFTKYSEDRIFLKEILPSGGLIGVGIPKSRRERETVTSTVVSGVKPSTLTILASLR